jgi:hypothetical protein
MRVIVNRGTTGIELNLSWSQGFESFDPAAKSVKEPNHDKPESFKKNLSF